MQSVSKIFKFLLGVVLVFAACYSPVIDPIIQQQGPASFALITVTADSVFVSARWNVATDPSGVSFYEWKDSTTSPAGAKILGSTTFLVDTFGVVKPPINSRHDHEFKVRAVDGIGNRGPYSAGTRWAIVYSDTTGPAAPGGVVLDTLIQISGSPQTLRALASARGFEIGTAVLDSAYRLDATYRNILVTQYNSIVTQDATDFWPIHPGPTQYAFANADTLVNFALANGMVIHGHSLSWYSWIPTWVTNGGYTNDQLRQIMKDHITTVVGRYKGKIASWDVVNEPIEESGNGLHPSFWIDHLGPEYIDSAFLWADRADPAAKLYLNEYNTERVALKADALLALATGLKSRGIPIDGVGFQMHTLHFWPHPTSAEIQTLFARFANAGFDIRITEMDVDIADTAGTAGLIAQAKAYSAILDACLKQPRCKELTTWGFIDKYDNWIHVAFPGWGRALPFDANYQPKPAFDSLLARLARP